LNKKTGSGGLLARSDPEIAARSEGGWLAQQTLVIAQMRFRSTFPDRISAFCVQILGRRSSDEVAAMDDQERLILQGAQNAWPQAISIAEYRLRHVADRLAERDLLEKRKFSGGKLGYQITSKGRDQLSERIRSIHARNVDAAEKMLRKSLGMKPPTVSSNRNSKTAAVIPLARKPLQEAQ
jgi:hypothetical protein